MRWTRSPSSPSSPWLHGDRRGRSYPLLAAALAVALCMPAAALALPGFADVKAGYTPSEAWLLDRHDQVLQRLRIDPQVRRLPWTRLEEIPPALQRAVILSEDKRFLEHDGVDWQAAGKAAWDNFWRPRSRGASTLSMQLAGLIDEDYRRRGQRSVLEKLSQSIAALRLEQSWNKRQILEAYLNLASFRGEQQGVAALSRHLFGKWPDGLDEREAALAAALLRAPNAAPAIVSRRACALLKEMGRGGECDGLDSFATQTLAGNGSARQDDYDQVAGEQTLAPHLARKLLNRPGQRLRSSLDAALQRFAAAALRRNLATLAKRNAQDGAVLVLDNASGEVLAWVGSSGPLSDAADVDGASALRQAGSTLKPFLYALAFERRNLTPASLLEDAPLTLDTGNGLYAPQDYAPEYRGWVSTRMALGGSLNVPAVKTLVRIGPDLFQQRLLRSGFASLKQSGEWYGYSLALGSADISLLMLANGYRTLANDGRWSPLRTTPSRDANIIPACAQSGCDGVFAGPPRAAYTPQAAFLVADILADRAARAGTFGLESWLATPYWSAAKTGTSKDMRDNWCAGFSRRYTVAVWVGNVTGEPMHDVSGVAGAAPVWREVMDWLQRGDPAHGHPGVASPAPRPPGGVVATNVHFEPAVEPPRREYFLAGTQPGAGIVRAASARALARIAYPTEGTIIALDPDIPPQRQRVPLRLSTAAGKNWRWRIDDRLVGKIAGSAPLTWLPHPGMHRLALLDAAGHEADVVRFEVRALRGKTAAQR